MTGIIRDDRIVCDVTFAARLREYLSVPDGDPVRDGERQYLIGVAERLLDHQERTATNEYEKAYLRMAGRNREQ